MTVETQEIKETESTIELNEIEIDAVEKEDEVPSILRTRRDGCWEVYDGVWGSYLRPTDDPEANIVVDEENLKQFQLKEGIHKIPADLWTRWAKLCFHYVDKVSSSVEVSIRILRSEEDPSKYRFLVPRQKVSGASVRVKTFDESVDIETGEELTQYPPSGWIPVGSSHSHNTMQAFFSGVDDQYELDDPGIHLVIGSINPSKMSYSIAASVVGSHRRFEMHYENLIDATWDKSVNFHGKVLDYIDHTTPTYTYKTGSIANTSTSNSWKKKETPTNEYKEWWQNNGAWSDGYGWGDSTDPYYWNDSGVSNTETSGKKKDIQLWHVEDIVKDYIFSNKDDIMVMIDLLETLKELTSDVEVGLELMVDSN